jgi:hypothetical protein
MLKKKVSLSPIMTFLGKKSNQLEPEDILLKRRKRRTLHLEIKLKFWIRYQQHSGFFSQPVYIGMYVCTGIGRKFSDLSFEGGKNSD